MAQRGLAQIDCIALTKEVTLRAARGTVVPPITIWASLDCLDARTGFPITALCSSIQAYIASDAVPQRDAFGGREFLIPTTT